jgi:formyl-CoA transferase
LADPQVAHLGLVQELELPSGTRTKTVISPMRIDKEIMPVRRRPPAAGEHSEEILRELGLKDASAAAE